MDRGWIKPVLLAAALAAVAWCLYALGSFLQVFILAALLAYVLQPWTDSLEARGLGRTAATGVVFGTILGLGALLLVLLFPIAVDEALAVRENLATGQAGRNLAELARTLERPLVALGMRDLDLFGRARAYLLELGEGTVGFLLNAVSLLVEAAMIPFLAFFLVRDSRRLKREMLAVVPNRFFEFTLNLLHRMDLQLGSYLRGQLVESAIVGVLAAASLAALRIDSFLFLGGFVGLTNLVPYIGPLVGGVPPVLVALMQFDDPTVALYAAGALAVIQLFDHTLLKTVVVGKSVDLEPLTFMVAVLVGGELFGILGMVLSIPVAGFLKVVAQETRINLAKYRLS
jgi:predicted PurR-regulated permease PerM